MLRLILSILLFASFFSCTSEAESNLSNDTSSDTESKSNVGSEDLLAKHWVFKDRVSPDGEKRIEYGDESSQRIIHFEEGGFFKIYDSITDQRILDKGVSRIEQLASGNWDLKKGGKQLRLNYRNNDNVDVEEYNISTLTNTELITESPTKGTNTYVSK